MLHDQPRGLSYGKILSNFKREHPTQCRTFFIRRALAQAPFKLSRNRYIVLKRKSKKTKKQTKSLSKSSVRAKKAPSSTATAATITTAVATTTTAPVSSATNLTRLFGSGVVDFSTLRNLFGIKQPTGATVFDNSTIVAPIVPTAPGHLVPQWQYKDGEWKNYDKAASDVVEVAYQEWKKNPYTDVRAIKSGEWQYMVDFNTMMQENIQHENHTRREIRREMISL